jgi:hypothetical protein
MWIFLSKQKGLKLMQTLKLNKANLWHLNLERYNARQERTYAVFNRVLGFLRKNWLALVLFGFGVAF